MFGCNNYLDQHHNALHTLFRGPKGLKNVQLLYSKGGGLGILILKKARGLTFAHNLHKSRYLHHSLIFLETTPLGEGHDVDYFNFNVDSSTLQEHGCGVGHDTMSTPHLFKRGSSTLTFFFEESLILPIIELGILTKPNFLYLLPILSPLPVMLQYQKCGLYCPFSSSFYLPTSSPSLRGYRAIKLPSYRLDIVPITFIGTTTTYCTQPTYQVHLRPGLVIRGSICEVAIGSFFRPLLILPKLFFFEPPTFVTRHPSRV